MNRPPASTDNPAPEMRAAIERCYDAYGADLAKWPEEARAQYGALAAAPAFAELRDSAEALDGFLNAATQPRAAADLQNRIMAGYAPPTQASSSVLERIEEFFFGHRFLPAGALAGVGALGLAVGVLTASGQSSLAPEYEAYAYLEDSLEISMLDDEGTVLWDAD